MKLSTPTKRQIEVLQGIWDSENRKETAARLGVSVKTIEFHMRDLQRKVGAESYLGAMKWGLRHKILFPLLFLAFNVYASSPFSWLFRHHRPPPTTYTTNYFLTWSYNLSMPHPGIAFNVWQSNSASQWVSLLQTNQPPVKLMAGQNTETFKVQSCNIVESPSQCSVWVYQNTPAPTNATLMSSVLLAWNPVPNSTAYWLYRGLSSGVYDTTNVGIISTNFTDTAIAGGLYYYAVSDWARVYLTNSTMVTATNLQSPLSAEVSFQTAGPPTPPYNVNVYSTVTSSIHL